MAIAAGMTSAITNPLHAEVQAAVMAADVLMGNDPDCAAWIRAGSASRRPRAGGGRREPAARRGAGARRATPAEDAAPAS